MTDPVQGEVKLNSRGPAQGAALLTFLGARAIPGLERADGEGRFRRNLPGGWLELSAPVDPAAAWLQLRYQLSADAGPEDLVALVRRVADLDTDLGPVARHLSGDEELAARLGAVGLTRLPGTFDAFELAVRAVVGQQVSVAAARTLLGRLVALVGPGTDTVASFPSAEAIADRSLDSLAALGMPASRRATIHELARAVVDGRVDLGPAADPDQLRAQLVALPGIGPWTAGYVIMRALSHADGWPRGDLVLRQSLGVSAAELERRAARWRPWRAYAALLLWRTAPAPAPAPQRRGRGQGDDA